MTINTIKLDKILADQICKLVDDSRTSVLELAKLAGEIRSQHFDVQSGKYDSSFSKFWVNFSMEERFGKIHNFTKYALAGEAISRVKAQFEQYEKRLPITLAALYEVSQLTTDELELCLQDKYRRTEITADRSKWSKGKKPTPLINPTVAASEIKSWRNNWRDPKSPNIDKRRLPLAEIKLHGSLYDFTDGKHSGLVSIERYKEIVSALKHLKENMDESILRIDIHEDELMASYKKREQASIKKAIEDASKEQKMDREKQLNEVEKALEHCLTTSLKTVPFKYIGIVTGSNGLFEETLVDNDYDNGESFISEPSINEFKQRIAQEYYDAYGPRRFLSLIERCQNTGPWSETTLASRKRDGKYAQTSVRKYQEELRVKRRLQASKSTRNAANQHRIDELLVLMSPNLQSKSDAELDVICKRVIAEMCPMEQMAA